MAWVLLRKSVLADHARHLPRPKIVQTVLRRGTKEACRELLEEICMLPEHQSSDLVEVTLEVMIDRKQKDFTSQQIHKGNGQRNPHR